MTIDYRRNQAVDNDEYNQLRLRSWSRENGFDWQPVLARSLGWVTAHADGKLIGFVNVAWDGGGHMFLLDTTVDPDYKRRGIGTELVRRAIELSAEAGGDWVHVDSDEVLMRDFYGGCGFLPTPAGLVNLHQIRAAAPPRLEQPLRGGEGWPVSRVGDVVYKAAGPWTSTVHTLLRHFEAVGFNGAPRLVGSGIAPDGREMLRFIEGGTNHPRAWREEGVRAVGRLLREMHEACRSFVEPAAAGWRETTFVTRPPRGDPNRIIGHCDPGPWNVVAQDGIPVAWVDWEFAGPVHVLDEIARTAYLNCHLHDDDVAERHGLSSPEERAHRLAAFCGGYELKPADRERLVSRMIEVAVQGSAADAREADITPETIGHIPRAWGVTWQVRSAWWMIRHRQLLEEAVRP
jgi:GNAT superfamily N-acetyltransferase